ncbi:uncharacterized protein LOC126812158 [Patella vulgata]|uniref:uncharacterized protein LOC126812158 n=1 Tax=Patella vulgata TaxID=6465 RepID=UPI0024A7E243|nr:uncharacterized protein LOC126812158 [Patella vulgata]
MMTLRGLSVSWPKFTTEYKETVTRIQSRYGMMKVGCKFDLKQVQDFVDRREKCERVYDKMVGYGKLEKSDLPEFFRQSGLYPTEGEITKAFNTIYRGSLNTAEVVFVLDCSASLGPVNFQNQLNFVKDIILGFDIAPDRVRIGLVPFNENVFHSFGLTQFQTREGVLEAIENLKYKTGLTRTDLALKMMRQIFKSSRPGVQKVALVITDGKSSDAGLTIREARLAREENIEIFTIVGYTVDADELEAVAGDKDHVRTCIDYSTIGQLKDLVKNRICLACCALCHHILPRIQSEGLYKSEVLDIFWTISPPLATGLGRSDHVDGKARNDNPGLTDVCRPLTRDEVIEILWTVYPPDGTGLEKRKSTWIRPIVDGVEAWSLLDDKIIKRTDYKKCLRFVIQSKLERDGYMEIPTDLRLGVERVSNLEEALQKVDAYLKMKERQKLEDELRQKAGQPRSGGDQLDSSEQPPIRVQILKIEHHDNGEPTEVTAADLIQYKHKEGEKNVEIITFDDEEARSSRGDGGLSTDGGVLKLKVPAQGTGSSKQVLESK